MSDVSPLSHQGDSHDRHPRPRRRPRSPRRRSLTAVHAQRPASCPIFRLLANSLAAPPQPGLLSDVENGATLPSAHTYLGLNLSEIRALPPLPSRESHAGTRGRRVRPAALAKVEIVALSHAFTNFADSISGQPRPGDPAWRAGAQRRPAILPDGGFSTARHHARPRRAMGADQMGGFRRRPGQRPIHRRPRHIAERDSFFMASVFETGWPLCPASRRAEGFLKVIDGATIAATGSISASAT